MAVHQDEFEATKAQGTVRLAQPPTALFPGMGKSREQADRSLLALLRMPESDAFDVDFEPIRIRVDDLES